MTGKIPECSHDLPDVRTSDSPFTRRRYVDVHFIGIPCIRSLHDEPHIKVSQLGQRINRNGLVQHLTITNGMIENVVLLFQLRDRANWYDLDVILVPQRSHAALCIEKQHRAKTWI